MVEFHTDANGVHKHVVTPIGELHDISPTVLAGLPIGAVDVLLCADDIVHDDDTHVKAKIVRNAFCGNEFLHTLKLPTGELLLAHVLSHHDHKTGEWIGIRAAMDHVVTFARASVSSSTTLQAASRLAESCWPLSIYYENDSFLRRHWLGYRHETPQIWIEMPVFSQPCLTGK